MTRSSERTVSATAISKSFRKQLHNLLAPGLLVLLFLISCEEDPSVIGGDILPQSDFSSIVAVDTMSMSFYTVFTDSARSVLPSVSYLGSILDPYFGLSKSDFVTQVNLSTNWPGQGILSVDSAKLKIYISDIVGEMSEPGIINLYETADQITSDSSYLVAEDVAVKTFITQVEIPVFDENPDTLVSLEVPVAFGEYMLRDTSLLYLRSDTTDFRDYFNALYFEYPQSGSNHLLQVNIVSGGSVFEVYYTNAAGSSRTYQFTMNSKCVSYNRYIHDYEQADPDKRINYINEPVRDTLAYVQSLNGVYTKLKIPGLESLKDSSIAINKARIYLPVYLNDLDYTEEMVPDRILVRYDSAGVKKILTDFFVDNEGVFLDGNYNKVNNRYKLNISNFVQNYIEGNIPKPEIEIYLPELSTRNLIIKANRESDDAARFELTYTVIN